MASNTSLKISGSPSLLSVTLRITVVMFLSALCRRRRSSGSIVYFSRRIVSSATILHAEDLATSTILRFTITTTSFSPEQICDDHQAVGPLGRNVPLQLHITAPVSFPGLCYLKSNARVTPPYLLPFERSGWIGVGDFYLRRMKLKVSTRCFLSAESWSIIAVYHGPWCIQFELRYWTHAGESRCNESDHQL